MRAQIIDLMTKIRDLKDIRTLTIRYDEAGLRREVDKRIEGCERELRILKVQLNK